MRLTAAASLLLACAGCAVLCLLGGAVAYARPIFASAAAASLLFAALGMGRRFRVPPVSWIALAFAPAVLLCALQLAPFGLEHPWTATDRALLHVGTSAPWSLDADGTRQALLWILALAAAALVWHCHARGERARVFAYVLLGLVSVHALCALVLALAGVDFPGPSIGFAARGCFVYQNHAAAFTACCLPLAILVARERQQLWAWCMVGVLALAVVLSTSRGGVMVAAAVTLPLAWTVLPRRRRAWWFLALVAGISTYLVAIGLHEVGAKFTRLIGPEGLTLDGRLTVWGHTLPLIATATALGTGANSAPLMFWHAGANEFPGMWVNHIHSDPLEWLLEFGWGGTAAIAIGLAALGIRLARVKPHDRTLYWGGVLGLVILALHSCADFIWNREAIALVAVVLLILAWEGREDTAARTVQNARWVRLTCVALAGVICWQLPRVWVEADEREQARAMDAWLEARAESGLRFEGAPLDRMLSRKASSTGMIVAQARLDLDLGGTPGERSEHQLDAERRLADAARRSPGDAGAWIERARLAALDPDRHPHELAADIDRILNWSPTWRYAQARLLECMRIGGIGILPPEGRRRLIEGLLAINQGEPAWFFPIAQGVLGTRTLAQDLVRSDSAALVRSALPWLAEHGSVEQWRSRAVALAPDQVALDPCQALLGAELSDAAARQRAETGLFDPGLPPPALKHVRLAIGISAEDRRAQSETLQRAGLPIPPELADALRHDGPPYDRWASPVQLDDATAVEALITTLRDQLFHPWAKDWYDAALDARGALAGESLRVGIGTDPLLVAAVLAHAPGLSGGERARLSAVIDDRRQPRWVELPGGHWTWIEATPVEAPIARLVSWQGVIIDGVWRGWERDVLTTKDLAPGLHRVVVLAPPVW